MWVASHSVHGSCTALINCFAVSDHFCMFAFLAQAERGWGGPSQRGGREGGTLRASRILSTEGRGRGHELSLSTRSLGAQRAAPGKEILGSRSGDNYASFLNGGRQRSRGPNEDGRPFQGWGGPAESGGRGFSSAPWTLGVSCKVLRRDIQAHSFHLPLHNRRVPPSPLKGSVLQQDIPPTRQEFTALTLLSCAPEHSS